jgi:uncharacterized membrane protein YedE/YeeE
MKNMQKIVKIVVFVALLLGIFIGLEKRVSLIVHAAEPVEVSAAAEISLTDDEEQTQQFYIVIVLGGLLMLIIIIAVIVAATSVIYSGLPVIFKDIEED